MNDKCFGAWSLDLLNSWAGECYRAVSEQERDDFHDPEIRLWKQEGY